MSAVAPQNTVKAFNKAKLWLAFKSLPGINRLQKHNPLLLKILIYLDQIGFDTSVDFLKSLKYNKTNGVFSDDICFSQILLNPSLLEKFLFLPHFSNAHRQKLTGLINDYYRSFPANQNPEVQHIDYNTKTNDITLTNFKGINNKRQRTEAEQAAYEHDKKLNRAANTCSLLVGLGEGMVAAVFGAAAYGVSLPIALLTMGIPGFAVNFILFGGAARSVLDNFCSFTHVIDKNGQPVFNKDGSPKKVRNIFVDEHGHEVSTKKKGAIGGISFFCFCSPLGFGAISFASGKAALAAIPLIGLMPHVAIAATAAVIATVTFLSLGALVHKGVSNLIKNDSGKKIKTFFADIYSRQHNESKVNYAVRTVLTTGFIAAATALTAVVTSCALTIGKAKAATVFHNSFKMTASAAKALAKLSIVDLGAAGWATINFVGAMGTRTLFNSATKAVKTLITNPEKALKYTIKAVKDAYKFPLRALKKVNKLLLSAFAFANGVGQGGQGRVLVADHAVQRMYAPGASTATIQKALIASTTTSSITLNANEIFSSSASEKACFAIDKAQVIETIEQEVSRFDPESGEKVLTNRNSKQKALQALQSRIYTLSERKTLSEVIDGWLISIADGSNETYEDILKTSHNRYSLFSKTNYTQSMMFVNKLKEDYGDMVLHCPSAAPAA